MDKFVDLLTSANHAIVYTGAGMSTESGIPDFRSESRGLWTKFNPDELAHVDALYNNRDEFTEFYRARLSEITEHKPHAGHLALAEWEDAGLIKGIITQNVDGFHTDAGNKNVMELHGTFNAFHCHSCKQEQSRDAYLAGDVICSNCGDIIRPGITLFGESLPEAAFSQAEEESQKADLFIVLGSSLSVTPANMFPMIAYESGAKLIIVNNDPTPFDSYADLIIQDKGIKQVLTEANKQIK